MITPGMITSIHHDAAAAGAGVLVLHLQALSASDSAGVT